MSVDILKPAAKRKRTEEDGSNSAPISVLSVWFEDGNVILEAENTKFKVHRGILAANSPVFHDMFSLPQPSSGENFVEGCPVVHLSDSGMDVMHILQAIYRPNYAALRGPLPFEMIAAFLRLGRKYDMEEVRTEALSRLYREFPTTLQEFDKAQHWSAVKHTPGIYFDIANLAREHNLLSVLPCALFRCYMRVDDVTKGIARRDGTIATLSRVNERACLAAFRPILQLQYETTYAWCHEESRCRSQYKCGANRRDFLNYTFFPTFETKTLLGRWDEAWGEGLCSSCVKLAKASHKSGCRRFWQKLPGVFHLPGWDELRKERIEDNRKRFQFPRKFKCS
ncbi:hypothetical protein FIBSPDRAFT_837642 [Athelia psychrophila]|uniref:BTB domain-containing protein n=1 Tax=Athelia psychrophila TaxID=1759441 RepID=A0A166ACA6_9AGAM|nr:hypothetical protein FIBSPDRAFT_837642 [Fibularhizoctonia sp. CBS 109695]